MEQRTILACATTILAASAGLVERLLPSTCSKFRIGGVSSPGQPVRQLCNLLVDHRIQDLQIPREIPADAIFRLRCTIIDRPGYKASPSGDLDPLYGARHVKRT